MVSLTNPLRNFKRTDLSLSRVMAVSQGLAIDPFFINSNPVSEQCVLVRYRGAIG